MAGRDYYRLGSWNACCDICGQKRKAEDLKLKWDGTMACNKCWEKRNVQDFVRGDKDPSGVPWSRDREATLTFADEATRPDGTTPAVVPLPVDSP